MGNPYAPRKKSNTEARSNHAEETPIEPQEESKTQEDIKEPKDAGERNLTVPEATMEGILDWVGEDKDRAAAAIEKENAQPKPRKTLLNKLEAI